MNILNYDIKNTKLFKKIMLSICSMMMVFASCFAPYSKVKALVGIDDVALSYVALSVLGLCGITLAGTTLSNTDITKLGSEVAGSISRTFDTLDKTVSDKWNLLLQTAGATGKIALDYVNDLKCNIQDWYNDMHSSNPSINSSTIYSGLSLSSFGFSSINLKIKNYSNNYIYGGIDTFDIYFKIGGILNDLWKPTFYVFFDSNHNRISLEGARYSLNKEGYFDSSEKVYYDCNLFVLSDTGKFLDGYDSYKYIDDKIVFDMYDTLTFSAYKDIPIFFKNIVNNFIAYYYMGKWNVLDKGTLKLDPPSKVTDAFKLDDRVLGQNNELNLADKIIGAVGSLDLDLTNDVVKSYGYVDVPSTTLDYPYTGTWDSTLDGIGAITWAPSTDIPIADTNVIAPTLPGTTDTDIPKVKDFTGEGSQLSFDWKGVFPFCIPFDLIAFLKCLCAEPQAPKIDIPFNVPIVNYKGSVSIDLSKYDEVAALCRTLFDLLFIVGLAYATRYLIKG